MLAAMLLYDKHRLSYLTRLRITLVYIEQLTNTSHRHDVVY